MIDQLGSGDSIIVNAESTQKIGSKTAGSTDKITITTSIDFKNIPVSYEGGETDSGDHAFRVSGESDITISNFKGTYTPYTRAASGEDGNMFNIRMEGAKFTLKDSTIDMDPGQKNGSSALHIGNSGGTTLDNVVGFAVPYT